jgi:hypothetical protein
MPLAAIASLGTFTAVLAESMAAIGLSSLAPTLLAAIGKVAKCTLEEALPEARQAAQAELDALLGQVKKLGGAFGTRGEDGLPVPSPGEVVADLMQAIGKGLHSLEEINLLIPAKASLDAEFEFHANESYAGEAAAGAQIQLVTVKAGFSALYSSASSNRVKLHLDFVSVPVDLRCRGALKGLAEALAQVLATRPAPEALTPEERARLAAAPEARLRAAIALAADPAKPKAEVLAALA